MSLSKMKKITRRSWDMNPITDTVINRVNILIKYQQEILVFINNRSRLIRYGDVELIGVDGDGD